MLVFHRKFHYFIVVFLCFLFWAKSNGDIPLDAEGEWNLFGRFRLRVEQDSDNVPLIPDRTRIRLGNFAGIRFTPDDHWELVVRGRAGDKRNSRTIDSTIYVDNGFSYGQSGFILDQYFANYTIDDYARITIGRAAMPFWSNTEKLWDQDLTPIGGALVAKLNSSSNPLELAIGSFHMPDGLNHFHAWMHAVQLHWAQEGRTWNWQWALSLFSRPGETGGRYLLLGEDERDYLIGQFSLRLSGQLWGRPAYVGLDWFENLEGYSSSDSDLISLTFRDETTGAAIAFNFGQNQKRGDWRFRYVYAHVEWLSAFSSYATTSFGWLQKSNVRVHDIRMDYSISDKWKLTGRVSPAKKIIGTRESTRYRIDMSRPF
jgi:hypothetical protein